MWRILCKEDLRWNSLFRAHFLIDDASSLFSSFLNVYERMYDRCECKDVNVWKIECMKDVMHRMIWCVPGLNWIIRWIFPWWKMCCVLIKQTKSCIKNNIFPAISHYAKACTSLHSGGTWVPPKSPRYITVMLEGFQGVLHRVPMMTRGSSFWVAVRLIVVKIAQQWFSGVVSTPPFFRM